MGALINYFNILLYIVPFFVYWRKNRSFDAGIFVFFLYVTTAVICGINYLRAPQLWNLSILPFLYLFFIIIIAVRPFLYNSAKLIDKLEVSQPKIFEYFAYIYIICGLIAISFSVQDIYYSLFVADLVDLLQSAYGGDVAAQYHNPAERFCKNVCGYSSVLAIIVAFYYMTIHNRKYKVAFLLLFCYVMLAVATNVVNASRGFVAQIVVHLLIAYLMFSSKMDKKIKKIIKNGGLVFLSIVIGYALYVTVFRFEDAVEDNYDGPLTSLLFYFGHSMLIFNNGLVDSIKQYMWGGYMFTPGNIHTTIDLDALTGSKASGSFYTFVGALYYDFGPLGTILLTLVVSIILYNLIRKRTIDFADLYIYYFFLFFVADGFLIIGPSYGLSVIMAFVLFLCLKFVCNIRILNIIKK